MVPHPSPRRNVTAAAPAASPGLDGVCVIDPDDGGGRRPAIDGRAHPGRTLMAVACSMRTAALARPAINRRAEATKDPEGP